MTIYVLHTLVFVIITCPRYESNSSLWIQRYTRYDTQRQKQTERARERERAGERGGYLINIHCKKETPVTRVTHLSISYIIYIMYNKCILIHGKCENITKALANRHVTLLPGTRTNGVGSQPMGQKDKRQYYVAYFYILLCVFVFCLIYFIYNNDMLYYYNRYIIGSSKGSAIIK